MSQYSLQVSNVLDGTLVPRMKRLISSISLIEPYTIDSKDLKDRSDELTYLTAIYDYLHEYEIGNEELDDQRLLQAIRLVGNISLNLQPEEYDPATNTQPQTTLFDVFIDSGPFTGSVTAGAHDIEVRYNGTAAVTKLIFNQKLVGAPGNTVYMQNVWFSQADTMEFRAYGNNNILLVSAEIAFQVT